MGDLYRYESSGLGVESRLYVAERLAAKFGSLKLAVGASGDVMRADQIAKCRVRGRVQ